MLIHRQARAIWNSFITSKTVNGVKHNYYYVDGQLRYERNGDSYEIYYTYDADGRPVLATKRDLVAKKNYQYYLITNTRGDIIETRNGDGNVNARFVYDAWGKLIAVTDVNGNALSQNSFAYQISLKYRGYVYDNETGLYYLQSRYYDPVTGRFINADDVDYIGYSGEQLSYNAFVYCSNSPINKIDMLGYMEAVLETYNKMRSLLLTMIGLLGTIGVLGVTIPKSVWLAVGAVAAVGVAGYAVGVAFAKRPPVPSKLKNGDKVKTPNTHPDEFSKNSDGSYNHNKTGWKFKLDKSGHYNGDHWDASPDGKFGNYRTIDLDGNIIK